MEKDYEIDFLGSGAFGCTVCPPIKLSNEKIKKTIDFSIPDFSFDKVSNCDYIGKILAVNKSSIIFNSDSYESELKNLLDIQELDPNGKYTPQLIYANIHTSKNFLDKIRKNEKLSECLIDKIKKENNYGYIILKNVGINIQKKYEVYEVNNYNFRLLLNCMDIILFLRKFIKLLEFLDQIYKKYIHLDIKGDNITEKNEEMFLIDFGRFQKINKDNVKKSVLGYLKQQHYTASFEPKIYYKLLKEHKQNINNKTIIYIIQYINDNFEKLIEPYVLHKLIRDIFEIIFDSDWKEQFKKGHIITFYGKEYNISNIDNYIRFRQKEYFINYLLEKYKFNDSKKISDVDVDDFLYNMFLPIINKIDMTSIGITFARIIICTNYNTYKECNPQFKKKV